MVSIKVKFRPSTAAGKEGAIYYQIIHKRVIRQLKTDYRIYADEWDRTNDAVVITSGSRTDIVLPIKDRIMRDIKRLNAIIGKLENHGNGFTADDIVEKYREAVNGNPFSNSWRVSSPN